MTQNTGQLTKNRSYRKKIEPRVLGFKEDWAVAPYIVFLIGFMASIIDFAMLQMIVFQLAWVIVGIVLMAFGRAMRSLPRRTLAKVGFESIWKTSYLQIVEIHRLVTDGYHKHIRHPVYLGEIGRVLGWAVALSSLYGIAFMIIGFVFLIIRIEMEERMLTEAFGSEFEEYKSRTKKLIPFLYKNCARNLCLKHWSMSLVETVLSIPQSGSQVCPLPEDSIEE
ncbi:MAG: isoprenylcysteine carboxylmethyltransferase family protein [Candidatus Thorarchaeota archaeon]|nr:MAG: isoprenylcysteine carboxylmethyltransferase family protein [Candidatus Thorarchaeota archaeon]